MNERKKKIVYVKELVAVEHSVHLQIFYTLFLFLDMHSSGKNSSK